jgi:hypothetical protein
MILYHVTRPEYLASIFRHGLDSRELPVSNGAFTIGWPWLTTDPDPTGHGLIPEKRAVSIRVNIPSLSRLIHWPKYARGRTCPAVYAKFDLDGGGKSGTW